MFIDNSPAILPHNQTGRQRFVMVIIPPGRLERPHTAPEADALSTELRGHHSHLTASVILLAYVIKVKRKMQGGNDNISVYENKS